MKAMQWEGGARGGYGVLRLHCIALIVGKFVALVAGSFDIFGGTVIADDDVFLEVFNP